MKPTIPVQQVKKAPTPVVVAQKAAIPPSQPKPVLVSAVEDMAIAQEDEEMM